MEERENNIKKFQKELLSGIAALVLLSVLDKSEKPLYGYQITKILGEGGKGFSLLKLGALYPVLRSLEKSALLSSSVEPSFSGPPRRYYSITQEGKETVREWQKIWGQTQDFVNEIVGGVD